jgi:hypothetical protein
VFDPTIKIFTGHPRHVQVGQDDVVTAMGKQFKRFTTILCDVDIVPVPPQGKVE